MAYSSIRTRSETPMASAPPLAPSPGTTAIPGARNRPRSQRSSADGPGRPADDGRVVAVEPIPVELHEVLQEEAEIIQGVGALGVARRLRPLPGGQACVCALLKPPEALLERGDLVPRGERIG